MGDGTTVGDFPVTQVVLPLEPEHLSDFAHGYPPLGHVILLNIVFKEDYTAPSELSSVAL
jgi:hypothetical protein